MAKKGPVGKETTSSYSEDVEAIEATLTERAGRPSALPETRIIYCGDNLEGLAKMPDRCVALNYIDPPFTDAATRIPIVQARRPLDERPLSRPARFTALNRGVDRV